MDAEELRLAHVELRDRLVDAELLIPTGVDGLYGRTAAFEHVVGGIDDQICILGNQDDPEVVEFPPLLPRATFDRIGYMETFPQLGGTVFSFMGGDRDHTAMLQQIQDGEPYADALSQTDIALTPACCYPVYPAATGRLPDAGRTFQLRTYCFRHEPSVDPMRMVAFRQREHVCLGSEEQVLLWRDGWFRRVPKLFEEIGIDVSTDVANDPFFGRAGRLMASAQLEQELKFEFAVPVYGVEHATACSSLNYHEEHFGELFDIETGDGNQAHSACIGFGVERCAVALFAKHGMNVETWPSAVKSRLWP
jgi:seryl-tRNA synthetase